MKTIVILISIIATLVLSGCDAFEEYPKYRTIAKLEHLCSTETMIDRAYFILQCVKNANPKSDEEPEDWLNICKQMAVETYCPLRTVLYKQYQETRYHAWANQRILDK